MTSGSALEAAELIGSWDIADLPDPDDHTHADWNGEPAYLAWYRRFSTHPDVYRIIVDHGLERKYAHAVPNEAALRALLDLGPLVEIGAGAGYWARLLADRGGDVVAYDKAPLSRAWTDIVEPWATVLPGGVEVAGHHPDRSLLACWPPRPNGFVVDLLRTAPQHTLALITDGRSAFQDRMYDMLESEWQLDSSVAIPTWPSRFDRLMIWRRA